VIERVDGAFGGSGALHEYKAESDS
jgi:hypothetical protein